MSMTKTFMDWEPNQDWTVFKPKAKTEDAATALDFNFDNLLDTTNIDTGAGVNTSFTDMYFKNTAIDMPKTTQSDTNFFGDAFSGKNIGGTLQGIGAIGGALASVYGISEQKKFNEDMLDMEKDRVAKEYEKRDKQQSEYDAVWKS